MTFVFPFIDILQCHHYIVYPKTCAPVCGRDLGMYSRNVYYLSKETTGVNSVL